ncbi:lethal(3)malignant brain tumor-like protein 3 [Garra rufa]|uniref:lethal(3)malignant brain tumor-like protein 3 n=1 Tax=Garra rufa TaxID=137080 RepID=UPI003CCE907F
MESSGPSTAAPEFDVYEAMDWKDGVGTLPGSELKFRVNEFGVLEVITDEMEEERGKKAHAKTTWSVPTAQEALSEAPVSKEETAWAQRGLVCVRCNRKGSVVDFLSNGLHCSERCLQQEQQEELKREGNRTNGEVLGRKRSRLTERLAEDLDSSMEYPDAKNFSWEKYLAETNSLPAPARAFKVKPPHSFQLNMKLEVVDKRNPALMRVATVVDTDDHRLRIHFDGWTDEYDYWIDADSPDIHPAGWCAKTGHPLQPPLTPQDMFETSEQGGCPTPGCKGVGHIKGARYSGHHSAVGCPYSDINLNKDSVLPDRLSGEMPGSGVGRPRRAEPNAEISADTTDKPVTSAPSHPDKPSTATAAMETPVKKPAGTETKRRVGRPCKVRKVEELPQEEEVESEVSSVTETKELTLQQALHQSVFMPCSSPSPSMPHCWDQHSKLLPTVAGITASKVAAWSVDEVIEFIQGLPGCREQVRTFREEQIDGEAFLLLTQVDLVKILSIKLGPALKIYNSILMFKTTENSACNEL